MDKTEKTSRYLKTLYSSNGRAKEDHSPKSVLFMDCPLCLDGDGNPIKREFQLATIHLGRGVSVYRCTVDSTHKVEVKQ